MATCQYCKEQVLDTANICPKCGKRIIPADELENVPKKTSTWQKVVIAISIVILIAIGFSFQGAEDRENKAAQENFSQPVEKIVRDIAGQTGLAQQYGLPNWKLNAETRSASVAIDFPNAKLTQDQAAAYGQGVCAALARAYVAKGYAPEHLTVTVGSGAALYGKAIFNGNIDALGWQPAK